MGEAVPVLVLVALGGIAVFGSLVLCTVTVARMRELPVWRRFLPPALFLLALAASLLRSVGVREVADAVAFPLNLAAVLLSVREIRARRLRNAAGAS
ncbi:hypothetical protein [Streptomyces sp. S1]|uniref:hypothetical protein n=1 Tax=Streptomyces sp. S1 TaxID=718288 RepID=UPI001F08D2C5|nr:hypothetical protein [Streptomyces sp. S1]